MLISQQKAILIVPKCPWLRYSIVLEKWVDNFVEGSQVNVCDWPAKTFGKQNLRNVLLVSAGNFTYGNIYLEPSLAFLLAAFSQWSNVARGSRFWFKIFVDKNLVTFVVHGRCWLNKLRSQKCLAGPREQSKAWIREQGLGGWLMIGLRICHDLI